MRSIPHGLATAHPVTIVRALNVLDATTRAAPGQPARR